VIAVADTSTDRADSDAVHHLARVTVVPVLVHELLLSDRVRAQLVVQRLVVLRRNIMQIATGIEGNSEDDFPKLREYCPSAESFSPYRLTIFM